MRLIIVSLVGFAFIGCSSNSQDPVIKEKIDLNEKLKIVSGSPIEKSLENKNSIIPFIGEFNLEEMKTDSFHNYGAGDCEGKITLKSYPHVVLGIDSSWCSQWGFEHTKYVMTKKNTLTAIHSFEHYIENEDSLGRNYVLRETVYDFNTEPLTIYVRKKEVNNELNFIDEKFSEHRNNKRDSIYSYWQNKLKITWIMDSEF